MLPAALAVVMMNAEPQWVVYESPKPNGKSIVFLSGDEEYRSEEAMPQLAKILAYRHGFKCTVLFSLNSKGEIDPNEHGNQPGMESLDTADLCIMLLRFRAWPDSQMKHFSDFYLRGKPIIGLRTSTHAFDYPTDSKSPYAKFGWRSKEWQGGFGRQVLGETWISHWGNHGSQATRGMISTPHQILYGVKDIFGTTDVYEASPPPDSKILVRGQVLSGMNPTDPPAKAMKKTSKGVDQDLNTPMMPIAWMRTPMNEAGKKNMIMTTTMGAATDLLNEGVRRLIVNSALFMTGTKLDKNHPTNVNLVGVYEPSKFGFEGFKKGLKPKDFAE